MKLLDLEPRWAGYGGLHGLPEAEGKRCYIGVVFLCPHCRATRLGVLFDNPIDDGIGWLVDHWPTNQEMRSARKLWHREGETFDTLSLSPSIDVSAHGHWHGFIRNGEIC